MQFKKVSHIVVDSGAFIKNAKVEDVGEKIYTCPGVIAEIRDPQTRKRLKILPYELIVREPSAASFAQVIQFSKKTGDSRSLSNTDLRVLALTLDLEQEFVGSDHIQREPKVTLADKEAAFRKMLEQKRSKCPEKKVTSSTDSAVTSDSDHLDNESPTSDVPEEEDEEEFPDEEKWITPENYDELALNGFNIEDFPEDESWSVPLPSGEDPTALVACLTTDFAMQNVLLQMSLQIVSVDGMLVKRPRSYGLWCFSCFESSLKMGIFFCPKCGNSTLHKIPVSIGEDGSLQFHFSSNYQFNLRGTKFPVPKPQGGKHAHNPIFVADQRLPQQRAKKEKLKTEFDTEDGSTPFSIHDLSSRAASLGIRPGRKYQNNLRPTRPSKKRPR